MLPTTADEPLRFGHFEIRPAERLLRIDGATVNVGARAFDLLLALARRRDRLVSRQELLDLVWPGVVVEEHNITAQISSLRKLLGPRVIATVPGRGYRFTALPEEARKVTPPATPTAPSSSATVQTHLPHQLAPLLGREEDLTALADLLQRYRLVTVVGAGGIGKSSLAQHLLAKLDGEYAHGICWVELASVSDPATLPSRIAEALGVRPAAGEPLAGLCGAVSSLSMLIALDNAEHLLADVSRTAAALLDAAPDVHLLVTSQAPLRLAAEHVYRVGPLAVPQGPLPAVLAQTFSAVALFVERARAADARFVLNDVGAPAAIELCRQLDGLPLAIELAAARAPLLGVQRLAASMQDRLQVLTHNRDAVAPARQQTLRAALDWSHGFLDERERTVFRRLSVMADTASLAFVQQVVADEQGPLDEWAVLDGLGTLVDRSLVAVVASDEDEPRYRLLESPRLFALERLRAAGEENALRRRHATALAAAFDRAWEERWSGRVGAQEWARRLRPDAGNARDAIAWARAAGDADIAVTVAATLFMALPRSSHLERMELADLCESLAERVAPPTLRLRARQLAVRPMYHHSQQQSLAVADRALALARELDRDAADRWPLYDALSEWICAAAVVARPDLATLHEALAELDALEDPRWPAQKMVRGCGARRLARVPFGDPKQPSEQLLLTRRWVAAVEAAGDDTAPCMGTLIDAELECGNVQAAVELGERVLAALAGTRDEWSLLMVRANLAEALLELDDTERARPLVEAMWPVAMRFDLHAICSDELALLAALEGRPRTAARLTGYADAAYAARGIIRHPNEASERERTASLARASLGSPTFDELFAEGRALRDEQAGTLAFALEDSA